MGMSEILLGSLAMANYREAFMLTVLSCQDRGESLSKESQRVPWKIKCKASSVKVVSA